MDFKSGILIYAICIGVIFGTAIITSSVESYKKITKYKNISEEYKSIISEKDSCIYELNEKLLMQNIEVENYKDSIIIYKDSINSLINELDSVNEEFQINKIKIERIREYNRIAAQDNNIKFLRGWINRVIN